MVYYGTENTELIVFHSIGDSSDMHFIGMIKAADERTFEVRSCCDRTWVYKFHMNNNSDYERVKFNIMEAVFDCDSMDELLDALSEVFEDGFEDILVHDDCDCNGDCGEECECCKHHDNITYLN